MTSAAVVHDAPGFAVRIENGATSLTYSGDTSPYPALAADCDLLLCAADNPAPGARSPHASGRRPDGERGTGTTAGRHPRRPEADPADAISRAAVHYDGDITHATPGRAIAIG